MKNMRTIYGLRMDVPSSAMFSGLQVLFKMAQDHFSVEAELNINVLSIH